METPCRLAGVNRHAERDALVRSERQVAFAAARLAREVTTWTPFLISSAALINAVSLLFARSPVT